MSKFNRGDRVRFKTRALDTSSTYRVVGDSHNNTSKLAIEGVESASIFGASEFELELVPQIPRLVYPYVVYGPDGMRADSYQSLQAAMTYCREGHMILHVTTGRWYDGKGNEVTP